MSRGEPVLRVSLRFPNPHTAYDHCGQFRHLPMNPLFALAFSNVVN